MNLMSNKYLNKVISWVVIILVPLIVLFTVLRLIMSPLFLAVEYRLPNFPKDAYGMTQDERLKYAPLAMEYLFNNEGVEFLGSQKFDDGSSLYTERELSHMLDVKILVKQGLKIYVIILIVFIAIAYIAKKGVTRSLIFTRSALLETAAWVRLRWSLDTVKILLKRAI